MLVAAAVTAAVAALPGSAAAVPTSCPSTGGPAGTVTVTEPAPGATVNGPVTVKGTAASPAGLSRVELFVGEALKDFQTFDPPRNSADLSLRWDAAEGPAGPAKLTVVLCGANPARVVQAGTVDVTIGAPATPPPTPARLTRAHERDRTTGPPWVGAAFAAGGVAALLAVTSARRRRPVPPAR